MGEILIPRRTKVEKGYELLADITVGTATTSVDITGLNIGKGDEVVLMTDIRTSTYDVGFYAYVNGNTTATNYYTQRLSVDNTNVGGVRGNYPSLCGTSASFTDKLYFQANLKLTNSGYFICQSNCNRFYGTSTICLDSRYITSTGTMTSITSLRVYATVTNAIGIGSRFQLYKIN